MNKAKQGFHILAKTAVLAFKGSFYEGAEVRVRLNVPLGTVLEISILGAQGDPDSLKRAMRLFGEHALLEWNLVDEAGDPIPASADGMLAIDAGLAALIISEWTQAVRSVPRPLSEPSTSGST
jgi:hypothetical protein